MSITNSSETSSPCACCLAAAVGVVWGIGLFVLGAITVWTEDYGHKMVEVLGSIYWGYVPGTWGGALLGLVWGFVDAAIGTFIIVVLYTFLRRACKRCCIVPRPAITEGSAGKVE